MIKQILVALVLVLCAACLVAQEEKPGPPIAVVDPGNSRQAPADAVVLFDGHDLSQWVSRDGSPAPWTVEEGVMVSKRGTGNIQSKPTFRDAQIHLEFSTPAMPEAHGQARANSGVILQGLYEIQILDSFQNPTYINGSCGSVYGQHDPLVNVCRPPGEWQSYDIIFHAPKCGNDSTVTAPGRVTVLQNGVLIQDDATVTGPTGSQKQGKVCEAGPLELQDHKHAGVKATAMRFRNVWFRPLAS